MREMMEQLAARLRKKIEVYTAFDGIPVRRKGQNDHVYAVLVPEQVKFQSPVPCGEGVWIPFTMGLKVSVFLPMHQNAAKAERIFEDILLPVLLEEGFQPDSTLLPEADPRTDRLICSRTFLLYSSRHKEGNRRIPVDFGEITLYPTTYKVTGVRLLEEEGTAGGQPKLMGTWCKGTRLTLEGTLAPDISPAKVISVLAAALRNAERRDVVVEGLVFPDAVLCQYSIQTKQNGTEIILVLYTAEILEAVQA